MEFITYEMHPPNECPTATILRRPLKPCCSRASASLAETIGKCVSSGASDLDEVGMKLIKKLAMSRASSLQSA